MRINEIDNLIEQLCPMLVERRRQIHANPELSFAETATSNLVATVLAEAGITVHRVAENGVIGVLQGDQAGKVIALRADMDALPITEKTGLPYASKNDGVMHACGHDGHTAVLLTVAEVLARQRHNLQGTVLFCFQGAEERSGGALPIIDWLEANYKPDQVAAIHFWADLPTNHISLVAGGRMAAGDPFIIEVQGQGGHGSRPDLAQDVMRTTAAIITQITSLPVNRLCLLEPTVVHIGKIEAGQAWNIYPDNAFIHGGLRTFSESSREKAKKLLVEVTNLVAKANGTEATLKFLGGTPVVNNDADAISLAKEVNRMSQTFAEDDFAPIVASENFGEFLLRYPGFMAFVGIKPSGASKTATQHEPTFALDEKMLPKTARFLTLYVMQVLGGCLEV